MFNLGKMKWVKENSRQKNTSKCKEQACLRNKPFTVAKRQIKRDGIIKVGTGPLNEWLLKAQNRQYKVYLKSKEKTH